MFKKYIFKEFKIIPTKFRKKHAKFCSNYRLIYSSLYTGKFTIAISNFISLLAFSYSWMCICRSVFQGQTKIHAMHPYSLEQRASHSDTHFSSSIACIERSKIYALCALVFVDNGLHSVVKCWQDDRCFLFQQKMTNSCQKRQYNFH